METNLRAVVVADSIDSGRWRRTLSDDRIVLGCLMFTLTWFVGGTFSTQPVLFVWFGLAVAGAMTMRLHRRRAESGSDFQSTATNRPQWIRLIGFALLLCLMTTSVVAIFGWRFAAQVSETSSLLVLAVDTIAHVCIALSCILWSVWSARGHVLLLLLGLVGVLMAVAGGGVSTTLTAQTAVGLTTCIGFLTAAQVILSRRESSSAKHIDSHRGGDRFVEVLRERGALAQSNRLAGSTEEVRFSFVEASWPYLLLSVSLILIVASAFARMGEWVLPTVQAEVFSQLKDRFEDPTSVSFLAGGRYVTGNRIGDIQTSMLNDPQLLALRGYCSTIPGYLRGNVFDDYSDGRWNTQRRWVFQYGRRPANVYRSQVISPVSEAKVPLSQSANPIRSRFLLELPFDSTSSRNDTTPIGSGATNGFGGQSIIGTIEIYGQPDHGPQTFFPATSVWIEAKANKIGLTPHGLIDRGIEPTQPWTVGVVAKPQIEPLTPNDRGLMLWVAPEIRPTLERVARRAVGNASTADAKADRIASYFQNRFTYTLRTELPPSDVDPLVHFLTTEHPAHCEYFASAAALMLRTVDVPSRYVTGYVMDELSDSQDYYLARNRDAHAWVEYYDEQQRRWKPLEPTPGRTFRTIEPSEQVASNGIQGNFVPESESGSSNWLQGMIGYLSSLRITDTLSVVFQFLQVPALVLLIGWLGWRARGETLDTHSQRLIIERRKMDRRLKRWGWVRRTSETLHQFAARLENVSPEDPRHDELKDASNWYRDHAVQLYRQASTKTASPLPGRVPSAIVR
ncbi:transglutaminase-like domain-containing protein [Neorhodopirellula pilleata]|uniref:Protein-glutamine gamma-glutamyltransferase n=1 Tax=Neorhodopirellula pilleata TaxID=2714738 RepID=A0A5C5ZKD4_9BACT|nr:transglutaminase-like domain-containing protein [Neorhodopirellula pilleata]TWT87842.1 Protein-glutamine gamma-glutamyltransferase [Neorhodopirellula pilleata]